MAHGYVECSCRDCFEVAVCGGLGGDECQPEDHLCGLCEEAGCLPDDGECQVQPDEEEIDQ